LALARGGTNADLSASGSATAFLAQDGSHVVTARSIVAADVPNLDAGKITTGTLALARGGTNADLSASGSATAVLAQDGSHAITARALVAADIPSLDAAKITTGTLALARGGTNADLSASGSATAVLAQDGSHVISARSLVAGDIPSLPWNANGNATADLTLANAGFKTTFNQTSAIDWTWANTTAATSSTASNSPRRVYAGRIFNAGADTAMAWTAQVVLGTVNNKAITNISETAGNAVTLTVGAGHGFVAGNWITLLGLTTGTWLNSQNCFISSVAATTITFTDPTSHGLQASHAETGTVTQIPLSEFTFANSGSAGDRRVVFPVSTIGSANPGNGAFSFTGQAALTGFGLDNTTSGGLAIYTISNSSATLMGFYIPAAAANGLTSRVASIEVGNTSVLNSTCSLAALLANFAVGLTGALTTSGVANPCVFVGGNGGGNGSMIATTGNQIGFGVGYGKASTTAFTFAPTSGTATFQCQVIKYTINQTGGANGNIAGLQINAVETAVGGTHLMFDLQAGSAGTTSQFSIKNNGKVTNYGAIATIGNGVPSEYATVDLTAQAAAIAATTLYAVPAGGAGRYRVSWVASVTTVDGAASVLGGAGGFQILYTDGDDSVVKTSPRTVTAGVDTDATNTTATAISGCIIVNAKASTNIQYQMGYTSTTPGQMKYNLHVVMEAL
jgi:hypothetical protein